MALLDLQNMKPETSSPGLKPPPGSRASKGCGGGGGGGGDNVSTLSVALCAV